MLTKLRLADLEVDPEAIQLETRGLNRERVQEYVIRMSAGDEFPPIDVFNDGGTLYLAGGFHRVQAAAFLGREEIEARVHIGTLQDAMIFAAVDNIGRGHGEPMSQAQKREAGERLLRLTDWSQAKIARELAVDPASVSRWASSIASAIDRQPTVTRGDTTYTMDVSNIGQREAVTELDAKPVEALHFERLLADDGETEDDDEPEWESCGHCAWNNRYDSWVCLQTGEIWSNYEGPCPCDLYIPASEYVHEPEPQPEPEEEQSDPMAVHYSSKTSQHGTPQVIIDATLACLGEIDLDPCSNSSEHPNVPAKWHYTEEDDGLSHRWAGRIYMNPPYGRVIDQWIDKVCMEYEQGDVTEAIVLVPTRSDTQWWLRLHDHPVCLITGRLTFIGNDNSAPFPSAVFYLGNRREAFYQVFSALGDCWRRVETEV